MPGYYRPPGMFARQKAGHMQRRTFLGSLLAGLATAFIPAKLFDFGSSKQPCNYPKPSGWRCTRELYHTGPCAAVPDLGGWVSYKFRYTVLPAPPRSYNLRPLEVPKSLEYAKALIGAGKLE